MKKLCLFFIASACAINFSYAQWISSGGNTTTSDKVGIGMSPPTQILSLQDASFPAIDFYTGANKRATISATSSQLTLNSATANPISLQINGTEMMHIDASGRVGLGTAGPERTLDVTGTGLFVTGTTYFNAATYQDHTGYRGVELGYDVSGQTGVIAASTAGAASNLALVTYDGAGNWAEKMRVAGNGYVGIGTKSPNAPIHLYRLTSDSGPLQIVENGHASNNAASTAYLNTSGNLFVGKERSVGGALLTGSTPYAGIVSTDTSYPLQFGAGDKLAATILPSGYVGIGTTTPGTVLDVQSALSTANFQNTAASNSPVIKIQQLNAGGNDVAQGLYIDARSSGSALDVYNGTTSLFRVKNNGYVGIGTASPDEALTVNGTLHSTEVKVTVSVLPDYVFKSDYKLPKLSSVESYINVNHHLPEIPSAAEVAANGMALGEMNTKLLKKVEELTLYVIDLKKELDQLKKGDKAISKVKKDKTKRSQ
jgi:hypothetical protein